MKPKKTIADILKDKSSTDDSLPDLDLSMGGFDLSTDSISLFGDEGEGVKPEKPEPFEKEMKTEAGAILSLIREKEKAWQDEFNLETELGFYFSVVFRSGKEMLKWCEENGVKLHFGNHCFIEELEEAFKRKYNIS